MFKARYFQARYFTGLEAGAGIEVGDNGIPALIHRRVRRFRSAKFRFRRGPN